MNIKKYVVKCPVGVTDDDGEELFYYPSFINGKLEDWYVEIKETTPTFYSLLSAEALRVKLQKDLPKLDLFISSIKCPLLNRY